MKNGEGEFDVVGVSKERTGGGKQYTTRQTAAANDQI
jgi:hypothetical protein